MNEYITKAKVIEAIEKAVAPEITTIGDHETSGYLQENPLNRLYQIFPPLTLRR